MRLLLLAAVALTFLLPARASAGGYAVTACSGPENGSWTEWEPSPFATAYVACPGGRIDVARPASGEGMVVRNVAGPGHAPAGTAAALAFDAPAGTTIAGIDFDADLVTNPGWSAGVYDATRRAWLWCGAHCATTVGQWVHQEIRGLASRRIEARLRCDAARCRRDVRRRGFIALRDVRVLLDDPAPPRLGACPRRARARGRGWLRGAPGPRVRRRGRERHPARPGRARRRADPRRRPPVRLHAAGALRRRGHGRALRHPDVGRRRAPPAARRGGRGRELELGRAPRAGRQHRRRPSRPRRSTAAPRGGRSGRARCASRSRPARRRRSSARGCGSAARAGAAPTAARRCRARARVSPRPTGPARTRVRVALEDAAGNVGPAAPPLTLRFDDRPPGAPDVSAADAWRNDAALPLAAEGEPPVSGVAGFRVRIGGRVAVVPASLPLGELPEGGTPVEVRAVSGAGLESTAVRTVLRLDRTAPSVAAAGAPAPGTWSRVPVRIGLRGRDQAGLAGMRSLGWRIDGGAEVVAAGDEAAIELGADGRHRIAYRATDAAGNRSAPQTLPVDVDRTPPETVAFEAPDPADPRAVRVVVADATSGVAGGRIELRRLSATGTPLPAAGRAAPPAWRRLPTSSTGGRLTALVDDAALAAGGYELRAVVADAAGNEAVGTRRVDGAPATLRLPLRRRTRLDVRRAGRLLHARLTAGGVPLADRAVTVTERLRGRDRRRPVCGRRTVIVAAAAACALSTDRAGRLDVRLPAGPSRTLSVAFAGDALLLPARGRAVVRTAARARLRVTPGAARAGGTVVFAGRLLGGHVPRGGKLVELQALVGTRLADVRDGPHRPPRTPPPPVPLRRLEPRPHVSRAPPRAARGGLSVRGRAEPPGGDPRAVRQAATCPVDERVRRYDPSAMPRGGLQATDELLAYLGRYGARTDEVLERVRTETQQMPSAQMQVSADQGALIELLVRLIGAKDALEVGTFTGYSAICIARGLADGGRLTCLELDDERAGIARRNLDAAGVADRVEILVGPAGESLEAMAAVPAYDFAFIDADKTGYPEYYELVLPRMRHGGLVLLDNMLQGGSVVDARDRQREGHRCAEPPHPRGRPRRHGDDDQRRRPDVRPRALSARYAAAPADRGARSAAPRRPAAGPGRSPGPCRSAGRRAPRAGPGARSPRPRR